MHRNSEAGIPSGFWHSSLQCQSMLNSKPHTSHTISAKGHASMQALQLPDTLGKVLTLPVRFVRTRNAFFTITISPSQKLPKKVVQRPYLMTKTYFVQCKFTWLHKNLAPPLHFSSVNMSTLSFCQLWNSPKKKATICEQTDKLAVQAWLSVQRCEERDIHRQAWTSWCHWDLNKVSWKYGEIWAVSDSFCICGDI